MKERISLLPKWVLTGTNPAFYDMESATAVEQTAKVYAKVQELLNDYNAFADEINTKVTEFLDGNNPEQEAFKNYINETMHNYIIMLDSKFAHQDREIQDGITYIKENIGDSVSVLVNEMKEDGVFDEIILNALDNVTSRLDGFEITIGDLTARIEALENVKYELVYNEENENISLVKTGGEA